uniref:Cubilin n=1 Tax=Anthurium amnicola TaxID=1678845 RepID=A0A1D1XHD2_9ARAE
MRGGLPLNSEITWLQRQWGLENITTAIFKCTRWQREETMDVINCPYHYFCDSVYPGDYPAAVDVSFLLIVAASYLSAMVFTLVDLARRYEAYHDSRLLMRRYLLPSGPVVLPALLLALANGHRTGAVVPLSSTGPVLFQLVLISALAFENPTDRSLKYALLESSTVSGILHASLYLDSVVLPYYTGLDVLVTSALSGECPTCVCRKEALVVGGRLVSYRGWSAATFAVVGTLCSRLACVLFGEEKLSLTVKLTLEGLAWMLLTRESVHVIVDFPQGTDLLQTAAHGAICVLMCVHVLRRVCSILACVTTLATTPKERKFSQGSV